MAEAEAVAVAELAPAGARAPRRCLVAVVHNWPVVYRQTAQSLMELGWGNRVAEAKAAHGFEEISFAWFSNMARVDSLRDVAAMSAIDDGFSHLLFLDADMVWPTDVLLRMLRHHDAGIVSGFYTLKAAPYAPVALRHGVLRDQSSVREFQHDMEAGLSNDTDLREQDVVGMGCTLIPVAVFGAMGARPWFAYQNDDDGWPLISEDVPFCVRAREAGYRVWLDPAVRCGHVSMNVVDHRWHRQYQTSLREASRSAAMTITPAATGGG